MTLYLGDAKEILKRIRSNSIDAVVTDPPYGLSFMGSKWDYDVPTTELWREVFRVLKPGGHLLAFFGTRTYHRGVVRIEDAGFEIRDQIQWIYGQGWPKSLDISKAIDKAAGAERTEILGKKYCGIHHRGGANCFTDDNWKAENRDGDFTYITAPATPEAKRWQGWGTALKPANEPVVLARKPLEKGLTVAANVLKWGTGAINVDETRIGNDQVESGRCGRSKTESVYKDGLKPQDVRSFVTGRFPANLILDETAAEMLDAQSGNLGVSRGGNSKNVGNRIYGKYKDSADGKACGFGDSGGASRFFYCAKASKAERNAGLEGMKNRHPTVKPIKLMEYLCKLITPPNGVVLDPFMGSGSTGIAAKHLGFRFIGIELKKEYFEIAKRRIKQARPGQF